MLGSPVKALQLRSAPLIAGLALAILAAMAVALPEPPIPAPEPGAQRGLLVGPGRLSAQLAEQLARQGFAYLAIDVTDASLGPDVLWREYLELVTSRRYPVWGWVDLDRYAARAGGAATGAAHAAHALRSLTLAGLYVYGDGAVDAAAELRRGRPGLPILPVVARRADAPAEGRYGLVVDAEEFLAAGSERCVPVLRAARLEATQVVALRDRAEGDYLVADVAVFAR